MHKKTFIYVMLAIFLISLTHIATANKLILDEALNTYPDVSFNGATMNNADACTLGGFTVSSGACIFDNVNPMPPNTLDVKPYYSGAEPNVVYTNTSLKAQNLTINIDTGTSPDWYLQVEDAYYGLKSGASATQYCCGTGWVDMANQISPQAFPAGGTYGNMTLSYNADNTSIDFWYNGVKACSVTTAATGGIDYFKLFSYTGGAAYVRLSNISFWNSSALPSITTNIGIPTNAEVYNLSDLSAQPRIYINATHDGGGGTTCTVNSTDYGTDQGAVGAYQATFINASPFNDGTYHYKVECENAGFSNGSDTVYFEVDRSSAYTGINSVTYNNFTTYAPTGEQYTRNLTYSINYACIDYTSTQIIRYINDTLDKITTATCLNASTHLNDSYVHNKEGEYNISFFFNTSILPEYNNEWAGNDTFISDLYAPTIETQSVAGSAGFHSPLANYTLRCNDTLFINLTYNSTVNNIELFYGENTTRDTNITNESILLQGENIFIATCADVISTTQVTTNFTAYAKNFSLIEETTGADWDYNNASSVIMYYDDNSTAFDFKAQGTSKVQFTSINQEKLRLQIIYNNGDIIDRYIDVSIGNDQDVRICANNETITHYEQIVISATEKPVTLFSIFPDCIVAQDYTRFVYEDSFILKGYTINALYSLYTYDEDNNKIFLASMDGSLPTFYNIDVLEFNLDQVEADLQGEALTVSKSGDLLTLYYQNNRDDSISTLFTITEVNTSTVLFTTTEEDNPNEVFVYFDTSTLSISNSSLLRADVQTTDKNGIVQSEYTYFNLNGSSGRMSAGFAIAISIILTIIGLTASVTRLGLGWFGTLAQLAAVIVLGFTVGGVYVLFIQGIQTIILIFVILMLTNQNYASVA